MEYNEILNKVCDLAVTVGRFQAEQRKTFKRDCVESKHSHDYVSYVDKESEKMIVSSLRNILPEAGFITEEKTTEQEAQGARYTWIVDPLDGTTNFIHDLGPWCVCIALTETVPQHPQGGGETARRNEYLLGVVYEVTRGELFYALKGNGAWLKSGDGSTTRLYASKTADLDQALIGVGYPYNADGFRDFATSLCARLYGRCASIRSLGSAEIELCYVASGRLDVYIESFIQPWDVAAGAAILQEAGGRISDYEGKDELWPSGRQVLATNGLVHKAMLEEIHDCRQG